MENLAESLGSLWPTPPPFPFSSAELVCSLGSCLKMIVTQ